MTERKQRRGAARRIWSKWPKEEEEQEWTEGKLRAGVRRRRGWGTGAALQD